MLLMQDLYSSTEAIPDPQTLTIKAIYDGQTVQDGNTKEQYRHGRMCRAKKSPASAPCPSFALWSAPEYRE